MDDNRSAASQLPSLHDAGGAKVPRHSRALTQMQSRMHAQADALNGTLSEMALSLEQLRHRLGNVARAPAAAVAHAATPAGRSLYPQEFALFGHHQALIAAMGATIELMARAERALHGAIDATDQGFAAIRGEAAA